MIMECKIAGKAFGRFVSSYAAGLLQGFTVHNLRSAFYFRATICPEKSYIHQPFTIKFLLVYTDCTTAL